MNDSHAHQQNKEAMFMRLTRLLEYLEWQEFPQNAEWRQDGQPWR